MDKKQNYGEHAEKRQVLGVDEGMGVEARGQQEQQHGEQREQPVVKKPRRQQVAKETADYEEQVRQEMTPEMDVPRVFQPQNPLCQQKQRQLKGNAVKSIMGLQQGFVAMQDIAGGVDDQVALIGFIACGAVVIQNGKSRKQE